MSRRGFVILSIAFAMTIPLEAGAVQPRPSSPPAAPIHSTLRFPAPATHVVEVEADVPTGRRPVIELMMAVWTPGSYLVREYSRNVEGVSATGAGGASLAVTKSAKNRWRIETGGIDRVRVRYRVYGREMSVRTNYVDPDFALLNGAATYLTLAGDTSPRPHAVRVELPAPWKTVVSPLQDVPGGPSREFRAPDFDTLVDSPMVAGNPAIYPFTVRGVTHYLVDIGEGGIWDGAKTVADVQKIVETATAFWGTVPYDKYVFFNLIVQASGGLEHKNACTLMANRWDIRTRRGYASWLDLVSHEFFHAWNVKRLRPLELGPFDYERENRTRMLWAAEGLTDYYGSLIAVRSGVITPQEYIASLSDAIGELQTTPGRLSMPVEQASQDAWIRYYRPDENSPNVSISYYTKGTIVGLLLDLEIRRLTSNAKSLDDVMRAAWAKYSGARGYTAEEFRALVSEVAGRDMSAWLHRALDTTEELDYAPLETVGLVVRADVPDPARPWIGLSPANGTLRNDNGRLVVVQVRRGTPAEAAGVSAEDEILAIGGYRVRPDQWVTRLDAWRPGDTVPLLVARREALVTLQVTFTSEPARGVKVEVDSTADAAAVARREAWLKS
jgi:predicted metalloprotease with PDZ domain